MSNTASVLSEARRVYYKEQELLTLPEHMSSSHRFWWNQCCSSFFVFCVVLLCTFTFRAPCCDVLYDFRMKMMFGSSLPQVVCMMEHVLFALFVFLCLWWCPTPIVLCFVFIRLVYPMSVFSNVYLQSTKLSPIECGISIYL